MGKELGWVCLGGTFAVISSMALIILSAFPSMVIADSNFRFPAEPASSNASDIHSPADQTAWVNYTGHCIVP